MFIYTVKSKQIRAILIILFVVLTVSVLVFLSKDSENASKDNNTVLLKAADSSERMSFISQFGWEVSEEPTEVREIVIPQTFDDVYKKYNEIQLAQGFDLSSYAGMRVKRWTYSVKNYAGYEDKDCIRINILVKDGTVIGGDVCSTELDGFMHGFSKPQK